MKFSFFIVLLWLSIVASAQNPEVDTTSIQPDKESKEVINEVIRAGKAPADKVQYVNQLTRYGFKNLFTRFQYNPRLPYSSQVNPHAELFMQDYLRTHSSQLVKMKSWGVPYFNLIDNILSQYGLPTELKYLAVIESNLKTSATSWVGAGGPWQFMPYTARDYGLRIDKFTDERRDYFKSTHAAAKYLLNLYSQLNDWLLVVAAYNGGPGRVFSAIKKSGSRNFWQLQYYLPQESRNHVKKFIATHYVMENPLTGQVNGSAFFKPLGKNEGLENNPSLTAEQLKDTEKQTISGKYNAAVIARNLSMPLHEFNKFNPGFDDRLGMNGQYDLLLPSEKMQLFLSMKYQILNECVQLLLEDKPLPNNKTVYPSKNKSKKPA